MQWLMLMTLLLMLLPVCRKVRALVRCGDDERARRLYRRAAWGLGGGILVSMAAQETLLFLAGQLTWATGLPLHLCSLTGLLVLPTLLSRRETLLHVLLCAGLPGAMLALAFPAVAETPWPRATEFFFHMMHAGLACAPLLPLSLGWRPNRRGIAGAGGFLLLAGGMAMVANMLTGGNYLFLAGPVAGTPLVDLARWGLAAYRLLLALLMGLALTVEALLLRLFHPQK